MLVVVKAIDDRGEPVATPPLTRKEALMKIWEFRTSDYTQIRTFSAETNQEINIVQNSD